MTQVWRGRSYSLARKLNRMNMLVSCTALLTACAAFVAYDLATFRESVVRNLSVEAQIIGSNSVSALEFDDPHSAEKTLSALNASPNIISAGIYGPNGRVFAAYSRDRGAKAPPLVALGNQTEAHSFRANEVLLTRSIVFGGKRAGTVRIRSDLESLYARLRRFGLIVAVVLGASLISAFLASSVFGKSTAEPIVRLAEIAGVVSRDKNYSLRASPANTRDELDTLIEAFNEMLVQIQERDVALNKAGAELEQQVEQRTAQLTAANQELAAFSYSVSHDLRAPLRHIAGFSAILMEDHGSQLLPAAQSYLTRIKDATENMGQLIDDLLNLARIGRQDMRRDTTDLNALVEGTIKDLETEQAGRQIDWRVKSLPTLDCDPGLIKVVFVNLLSNAVKYTRGRKPAVIEVGTKSSDGVSTIYVRDNGVGFDPKYADKLFGVFQRLHRKEEFEGTGIGLATVQRIVRRHGGTIWAEAESGKGAAFYFTMQPAGNGTENAAAEAEEVKV
jgi:signal transduction histidine kinase